MSNSFAEVVIDESKTSSEIIVDCEPILGKAVEEFGAPAQMLMAIEEMAELTKAINKAFRKGLIDHSGVAIPSKHMSIDEVNAYNDLCSELADVKIMIAQLELMLCRERVSISTGRKLSRLRDRIRSYVKSKLTL